MLIVSQRAYPAVRLAAIASRDTQVPDHAHESTDGSDLCGLIWYTLIGLLRSTNCVGSGRLVLELVLMITFEPDRGRLRGLPMLRWLDYDPIAVITLIVGIGVVSLLALSI